jgi:hypothetical protein
MSSDKGRSLEPLARFVQDKVGGLGAALPLYVPTPRPVGRGLSVATTLTASSAEGVSLREGIPTRRVRATNGRCVQAPPIFGVTLREARVITDARAFAVIVTRAGRIVDELSVDYRGRPGRYQSVRFLQRIPEVRRSERCASLLTGGGGPTNYFHWLYDVLPRAHVLGQAGLLDDGVTVLVPEVRHRFQWETLEHLGVVPDRCVSIAGPVSIHAEEIVAITGPRNHGFVEPWVPAFLRESFVTPVSSTRRRIYINRQDATLRTIVNEPALEAALATIDVASVSLSDLGVTQQAELFASADLIVAPHGAGLANLAFCRPGTRIIELVGEGLSWPVYAELARDIGLQYTAVEGLRIAASRVVPAAVQRHLGRVWDARVDVGRVLAAVDRALGG